MFSVLDSWIESKNPGRDLLIFSLSYIEQITMALQEACRDGHKHLPSPTKAECAGARWGSCSGWVTRTWPRPAWAGPAAPPLRDEAVTALSCCQCCLEPGLLQEPWGLGASFSLVLVLTETSTGAGATCRCWCYLLLCKHTAAAL